MKSPALRGLTVAALALAALLASITTAQAAPARWQASYTATAAVAPLGFTFPAPYYNTFRGRNRSGTPGVLDYADLDAFRTAAPGIPAGTRVLYDMETWDFTPTYQKLHPYASERTFVAVAHRHGLVAGLCPATKFLPGGTYPLGATIAADFFVLQGRGMRATGRVLHDYVRLIERQQAGWVAPKLAVIPGNSLDFLLSQWRTLRDITGHFVIWGARDDASAHKAARLLGRVGGILQ